MSSTTGLRWLPDSDQRRSPTYLAAADGRSRRHSVLLLLHRCYQARQLILTQIEGSAFHPESVPLVNTETAEIMELHTIGKPLRPTFGWLATLVTVVSSLLKSRAALQLKNVALRHQIVTAHPSISTNGVCAITCKCSAISFIGARTI